MTSSLSFEKLIQLVECIGPYVSYITQVTHVLYIGYLQPCLDTIFYENMQDSNIDMSIIFCSLDIALGFFLIFFSRDYILCVAAIEAFRLGGWDTNMRLALRQLVRS